MTNKASYSSDRIEKRRPARQVPAPGRDEEQEEEVDEDDAMIRESGNILLDYIGITHQIAYTDTSLDAAAIP